jgi:hypothetical protein
MIETLEPQRTLYDALAVVAPTGVDRGETMITLSKETADGDAEAFAIPEEVFSAAASPAVRCVTC